MVRATIVSEQSGDIGYKLGYHNNRVIHTIVYLQSEGQKLIREYMYFQKRN